MKPTSIIVPNMDRFVRESTDFGPTGAIWRRLKKLNFSELLTLLSHQLPYTRALINKDFSAAILLLIDTELVTTNSSQTIILSAAITDLCVALGNHKLLSLFINHCHRHHRAAAGLLTNNPGPLMARLGQWRLSPDLIKIGPIASAVKSTLPPLHPSV